MSDDLSMSGKDDDAATTRPTAVNAPAAGPHPKRTPTPSIPDVVRGTEPPPTDGEITRTFTPTDIEALRKLLRADAGQGPPAATPPRRQPATRHTPPPNIGGGLATVLVVSVITTLAVLALVAWLTLR